MKSVMVDIETLSTADDACVISIGLAAFDEHGVTRTLGIALDPKDWDGHINPTTVKWWMKQDEHAQQYSFNGKEKWQTATLLLQEFLADADEVWANSPQFDLTILKQWWGRHRSDPFPVEYKAHRDCRTIFAEARRLGIELGDAYKMGTTAHNPVDDAANQARAIVEWRKHFGGA